MHTATHKANGFTFLRIVAALLVIITHSYVVLGLPGDPLDHLHLPPFSKWGVDTFFVISGFLVTASLMRNGDPVRYIRNRALRILPGLFVMVALTVFVVGPLFSSSAGYWSREAFQYFWNALIFRLTPFLPGVFADNPVAVVNGSLWTLPIEVLCYAGLLVIGWAGALKPRIIAVLIAVTTLLHVGSAFRPGEYFLTVEKLRLNEFAALFLGGAFLASLGSRLPITWKLTGLCATGVVAGLLLSSRVWHLPLVGAVQWQVASLAHLLLFPYVVISTALLLRRLDWLNKHDISYGLYIYAWVVQQIVVATLGRDVGPWVLTALSILMTGILAVLSWRYVEGPALRLKDAAPWRRGPAGQPGAATELFPAAGNKESPLPASVRQG